MALFLSWFIHLHNESLGIRHELCTHLAAPCAVNANAEEFLTLSVEQPETNPMSNDLGTCYVCPTVVFYLVRLTSQDYLHLTQQCITFVTTKVYLQCVKRRSMTQPSPSSGKTTCEGLFLWYELTVTVTTFRLYSVLNDLLFSNITRLWLELFF